MKRKLEELGGSLDDEERSLLSLFEGASLPATPPKLSLQPPLRPYSPEQPQFILRMFDLPDTTNVTGPTRLKSERKQESKQESKFPHTMEVNNGELAAHVDSHTGFNLRWRLVDRSDPERTVFTSELLDDGTFPPPRLFFSLSLVFDVDGKKVTGDDFDPCMKHLTGSQKKPSHELLGDGEKNGHGRKDVVMSDNGTIHIHVQQLNTLSSKFISRKNPKLRFVVECVSMDNVADKMKNQVLLQAQSPAFYCHARSNLKPPE
jgi:hypothetical protein